VLIATSALSTGSGNNTPGTTGSNNTTQERDVALSVSTMTAAANLNGAKFVLQSDSTISYAVTTNNAGPSDSTNTVLTVNFPIGSTFAQPAICNTGGAA